MEHEDVVLHNSISHQTCESSPEHTHVRTGKPRFLQRLASPSRWRTPHSAPTSSACCHYISLPSSMVSASRSSRPSLPRSRPLGQVFYGLGLSVVSAKPSKVSASRPSLLRSRPLGHTGTDGFISVNRQGPLDRGRSNG